MILWILVANFVTKVLSCSYPGSPAHSTVTFNTEAVQTGTVATYRCEPGFDLLGPIRRLCVENGTWIPIGIPVCGHGPFLPTTSICKFKYSPIAFAAAWGMLRPLAFDCIHTQEFYFTKASLSRQALLVQECS
ncbi:hypothetical protein AVEN_93887-1 [Araneus ventricosus]|uniref:Sushi domain-containing protein n=1 Tax=Araneus ventricosus TaxID=182803 RepID=A0A4Y2B0K1_ARAVE|nr:hypothetical protein AVEN_93887-1 [Araneus ventricosus]